MEMDQGPLGGDPVPWLSQLPRWSVALLLCALNLLGNRDRLWIGGVNFYFNGQNGRKMDLNIAWLQYIWGRSVSGHRCVISLVEWSNSMSYICHFQSLHVVYTMYQPPDCSLTHREHDMDHLQKWSGARP